MWTNNSRSTNFFTTGLMGDLLTRIRSQITINRPPWERLEIPALEIGIEPKQRDGPDPSAISVTGMVMST
jgi:hypothetical protein